MRLLFALVAAALTLTVAPAAQAGDPIRVGSKRFPESYVLAELFACAARGEGATVEHRRGLGGTALVYRALEEGAIDLYPEYTGTVAETITHTARADIASLRAALAPRGIGVSEPLGFENTYALATPRPVSERLGLVRVSDLGAHRGLRVGLSHEFMGRADGWKGLTTTYAIAFDDVRGMDHAVAYEALAAGSIDVMDVYTTDAKIARMGLTVLRDDRRFFPPYEAVFLYRLDRAARDPRLAASLARLAGKVDARRMASANARTEIDGVPDAQAGAELFSEIEGGAAPGRAAVVRPGFWRGSFAAVAQHGPRHAMLVGVSLALSTFVGVPLGVLARTRRRLGAAVMAVSGLVQTIPSLALFCFFVPVLGIGPLPALAALFLYGLLPVVRNTHAGLVSIPAPTLEAATAIGLSPRERMRHVELPLAARTILAGVKTSAIVGVGTATIAAFVGAGGLGEPISTGLSLNDTQMILHGAVPAALFALLVQALFAVVERLIVPRALRA